MSNDIALVPAVATEAMLEEGVLSLGAMIDAGMLSNEAYLTQVVSNIWEDMHAAYRGGGKVED